MEVEKDNLTEFSALHSACEEVRDIAVYDFAKDLNELLLKFHIVYNFDYIGFVMSTPTFDDGDVPTASSDFFIFKDNTFFSFGWRDLDDAKSILTQFKVTPKEQYIEDTSEGFYISNLMSKLHLLIHQTIGTNIKGLITVKNDIVNYETDYYDPGY